jgi:large subunit ribosomal protein L24
MLKIRRDDEVIVLAGKDKGKRGKVLRVLDNNRVMVSGVNMIKRHTKPNPNAGIAGGIVEKEAALDISNVAIFNPASNKADRVGFKILEDNKKVRVFKSNGEVIDA